MTPVISSIVSLCLFVAALISIILALIDGRYFAENLVAAALLFGACFFECLATYLEYKRRKV